MTDVTVTSTPASGDTYELGETIVLRVQFSQPVVVTGSPKLTLTIGRAARYSCTGCPGRRSWMDFEYTVRNSDAAATGIGIGENALLLNGGTIKAAVGPSPVVLAVRNSIFSSHKVDGSQETPPVVSRVTFRSAPSGHGYRAGERIVVQVNFDRSVAVAGMPRLALTIGDQVRQAKYCAVCVAGNASAVFEYAVRAGDADADGIGIGAITLNNGSVMLLGSTTTSANVALGRHATARVARHRVSGHAESTGRSGSTSTPQVGDSRSTCDKTDKWEMALPYCDLRIVVAAFQRERILQPKQDTLNRKLQCSDVKKSSPDSVQRPQQKACPRGDGPPEPGRQVNIPCGPDTDTIHRVVIVPDFLIETHQKYKELKKDAEIKVQEEQIAEIGDDLEELLRKNGLFKRMDAYVRAGASFSDALRNGHVDGQDKSLTKAVYDIVWHTKSYRDFVFYGGMGLAPVFAAWSLADTGACHCRDSEQLPSNILVHSTRGFYYDVAVKRYWKDYRVASFLSIGQERILDHVIRIERRASATGESEGEQDAVLTDNGVGVWSTKIDLGLTLQFFDVDDRDLIDYMAAEPMFDAGVGLRYNGRWKPKRALAGLRTDNSGAFADTRVRMFWRASVDLTAVVDNRDADQKKPFGLLVVAEQELDWPAGNRKVPSTTRILLIGELLFGLP